MKSAMQTVLAAVGVLALLVGLGSALNYAGYANFRFFAPKMEQVRYDTFKESQAFNEGTIRELYQYRVAYDKATPEQRDGLRGAIMHQFSTYPRERLPLDLQQFYTRVEVEGGAK